MRGVVLGVLVALMWPSSAGAADRVRPINEGGDDAACVTSAEYDAGEWKWKHRIHRVFDTRGVVVDPSRMRPYAILDAQRAPVKSREVRSYPICPRPADGVYGGEVLIEYDTSTPRAVMTMGHYDEWVDWAR